MPFVPPEELLPWLLENHLLPVDSEMEDKIAQYWRYLADKGMPHTADKVDTKCIPLYLWGDDTVYDEQGSKLMVLVLGCVLDEREAARSTIFPVFVYQVDFWHAQNYISFW